MGLVSPVREGHWKESGWARTALWLSRERGRPHARLGMCTHLFFPFSSILTHVLDLYFSRTPEHIAQRKKRGQSFRHPETHGLGEGGKKIAREGPMSGLLGLGFRCGCARPALPTIHELAVQGTALLRPPYLRTLVWIALLATHHTSSSAPASRRPARSCRPPWEPA